MCFGGGGGDQYDAYSTGDFERWKSAFDQKAEIETRLARGEISQSQANRQIAALEQGTPGRVVQAAPQPATQPRVGNAASMRGDVGGAPQPAARSRTSNAANMRGDIGGAPQASSGPKTVGGTPGVDFDSMATKIKQDPSASMELRELQRQHDVNLGRIGIDKAFDKFDKGYYDQYKKDYTGYYNPQVQRQYDDATDKMTAALAGRGILESSIGANKFADLTRENTEARTNIANEAQDAANKLRGSVENEKSSLYSLNEASADPQAVNAQAVGQASALVAPPQYSPLGQIFATALEPLSSYASAKRNTPTKQYKSPYPTGYGSGSVVN